MIQIKWIKTTISARILWSICEYHQIYDPIAYHRIKFFQRKRLGRIQNIPMNFGGTLRVRFSDFKTYTKAETLDGFSDSLEETRKAAFDCLGRFELQKKVCLIGVRISNVKKSSFLSF